MYVSLLTCILSSATLMRLIHTAECVSLYFNLYSLLRYLNAVDTYSRMCVSLLTCTLSSAVLMRWYVQQNVCLSINFCSFLRYLNAVDTFSRMCVSLLTCTLSSAILMRFTALKLIYEVGFLSVTWCSMWPPSRWICGASVAFFRVLMHFLVNCHYTSDAYSESFISCRRHVV